MAETLVIFGLVMFVIFLLRFIFNTSVPEITDIKRAPKIESNTKKENIPTKKVYPKVHIPSAKTRLQELSDLADEMDTVLKCKYCEKLAQLGRPLQNSERYILRNIIETEDALTGTCRSCGRTLVFNFHHNR